MTMALPFAQKVDFNRRTTAGSRLTNRDIKTLNLELVEKLDERLSVFESPQGSRLQLTENPKSLLFKLLGPLVDPSYTVTSRYQLSGARTQRRLTNYI